MTKRLVKDEHGVARCWWCVGDPLYQHYHDTEWGFPAADDTRLFEKLCLEGFQAGLSWLTILRKRENFRIAFKHFDFEAIARLNRRSVARLMQDAGIVRHRGKIESVLNNARRALELVEEHGSLAAQLWSYEPKPAARSARVTLRALQKRTETAESRALSAYLRRCGWSFVGPTTLYAFMQSVGIVNDHIEGCAARAEVERARSRFTRPL